MKTRIFLIIFISVIALSFTTTESKETDRMITPAPELLTISNIADFECLLENDGMVSELIPIVWTGAAEYGRPYYIDVREERLDYYESNFNKFPIGQHIDNNHEVWLFLEGSRADVEAAMSKDDEVDVDDD